MSAPRDWPGMADHSGRPAADAARGFADTTVWIFDLDNTLYPAESNLFGQVDVRMGEFIANYLSVPYEEARYLQKHYYRSFGTTLSGLMSVHGMKPGPFLDYVHDIDLAPVPELPRLAAAIDKLPGRKLIFTNGTCAHAERVARKVGVLDLFEGIFDIVAADYIPKPDRTAYDAMLSRHGVAPQVSAMFEDMPQNLAEPHALGMTTVLVHSSYYDHPIQHKIKEWSEPPKHVHHMTEDLTGFLDAISDQRENPPAP